MTTRYDAIIIGTGQSGPSLAVELAKAGRQVAIVERHRFGGTCVNSGMMDLDELPEHLVVVGGSYIGCIVGSAASNAV